VRRVPLLIGLLALALACLLPGAALAAGPDDVQALENEGVRDIIVARDPGLSAGARGDLRAGAGVTHVGDLPLADTEVVRAPAGGLVEAVAALNAEPGVRYAEPNGPVYAASADPLFGELWALNNTGQTVNTVAGTAGADIRAPQAWTRSTGAGQTVAVVDSGALTTHQDLQGGAIWTNPGEAGANAANGLDDDHDGFVDDVHGWNFVAGTNDPTDLEGHGTHVSGILAARKDNNVGVAGIAPSATIIPLRALGGTPVTGTEADIASALDLAGTKARIVNASIEDPAFSQAIEDAIAKHPNTLYVVAAGNATAPATGANNDVTPTYPCALPDANIICVGASTATDAAASYSNFGPSTVDLFAPGDNIDSTYVSSFCGATTPDCYAALDGTSMAAPFVSGTLALMGALNPGLAAADLKARLLASVAHPAALAGKSLTGGRLDAAAAVAAAAPAAPAPPPPAPATTPAPAPAAAAAAAGAPAPATAVSPVTVASVAAPALGRPALSGATLTATRPVTIRFTLDRAATVRVTVLRGTRSVATVTLHGRKGANRYVLRTKVGAHRLARGRYRVKLQAKAGTAASKTYSLSVTVR
jgi:thermitase